MPHYLKQYDQVELRWRTSVDLSEADSVRLLVSSAVRPATPIIDKIVGVDPSDPEVIVAVLTTEETATPGRYLVEFETVWPDGQVVTIPDRGYEKLTILADLGGIEEESES